MQLFNLHPTSDNSNKIVDIWPLTHSMLEILRLRSDSQSGLWREPLTLEEKLSIIPSFPSIRSVVLHALKEVPFGMTAHFRDVEEVVIVVGAAPVDIVGGNRSSRRTSSETRDARTRTRISSAGGSEANIDMSIPDRWSASEGLFQDVFVKTRRIRIVGPGGKEGQLPLGMGRKADRGEKGK
jgi:hypothetical protein